MSLSIAQPAQSFLKRRGLLVAAAALAASSKRAFAAAPAPGTEDYDVLTPYSEWMQLQTNSLGKSCCGSGDGRVVEQKYTHGHYIVRIPPGKYVNLPNGSDWFDVPDEKLNLRSNPTGVPVLWLNTYVRINSLTDILKAIYCFTPAPDGT